MVAPTPDVLKAWRDYFHLDASDEDLVRIGEAFARHYLSALPLFDPTMPKDARTRLLNELVPPGGELNAKAT